MKNNQIFGFKKHKIVFDFVIIMFLKVKRCDVSRWNKSILQFANAQSQQAVACKKFPILLSVVCMHAGRIVVSEN